MFTRELTSYIALNNLYSVRSEVFYSTQWYFFTDRIIDVKNRDHEIGFDMGKG